MRPRVVGGDEIGSLSLGSQEISITTPTGDVKRGHISTIPFTEFGRSCPDVRKGKRVPAPFSRFTGAPSPTSLAMGIQAIFFPLPLTYIFFRAGRWWCDAPWRTGCNSGKETLGSDYGRVWERGKLWLGYVEISRVWTMNEANKLL